MHFLYIYIYIYIYMHCYPIRSFDCFYIISKSTLVNDNILQKAKCTIETCERVWYGLLKAQVLSFLTINEPGCSVSVKIVGMHYITSEVKWLGFEWFYILVCWRVTTWNIKHNLRGEHSGQSSTSCKWKNTMILRKHHPFDNICRLSCWHMLHILTMQPNTEAYSKY